MLESIIYGYRNNVDRDRNFVLEDKSFGNFTGHAVGAAVYGYFKPLINLYHKITGSDKSK